jgi:hypothetical protein
MSLQDEIDSARNEIRTDGYPMSISEIMSLYEHNEIDIHPEFQRFFRWSDTQKSMLIESILLGIPIPPIFVSQRSDGVWDVIDGLQRLSTIFQFAGILKDEDGKLVPPLSLQSTKYLPSTEGKYWDKPQDKKSSFTSTQRLLIKRAKLDISIVERESDEKIKYELFQRLNTGGSIATPQEVRNCMMVMLNRNFYKWLRNLADYDTFQQCIALSDRLFEEQYDVELALRFIVLLEISAADLKQIKDIGVFLTDQMVNLTRKEASDLKVYERVFVTTFDALARTTNSNSFRRYTKDEDRFMGGFLLSAYEVVALGMGYNSSKLPKDKEIEPRIKGIWNNKKYTEWSGSGITAMRRLPHIIPFKP